MLQFKKDREYLAKNINPKIFTDYKILDIGSATGEMFDSFNVNKKNTCYN